MVQCGTVEELILVLAMILGKCMGVRKERGHGRYGWKFRKYG